MAILNQGILGGISGAIGNVVGSSWKGISVIKTKPLSVANPQTAGQVAQRTKMTNTVAFAKEILSGVIKPLWDRFAQKQSGYNEFVSTNIALFESEMPSPAADLVISKGKMAATEIATSGAVVADETITLTWVDDSGSGFKLATDEVYAVAFNEANQEVGYSSADAVRSDGTVEIEMASGTPLGSTVNTYLAFRRADGTIVSDTAFLVASY